MTDIAAEEPPLLSIVKEVVDALGTLIAGHVRLARVELGEEARRHVRRASYIVLATAVALVGYAFACMGAAVLLARPLGLAPALGIVGGVHLVGAAIALVLLMTRTPRRAFDESISALDRTVSTLAVTAGELARPPARAQTTEGEGVVHVIS